MDLTRQHLSPIFENIAELLGGTPGLLEQFEPWATAQARRLRDAASAGAASVAYEAELLRAELEQMEVPASFTRMTTDRTERLHLCQRLWLTGLIDFVDDLLAAQAEGARPRAA